MKTVVIIQSRMGSSRLPGKALLLIAGKPMLQHVIERTLQAIPDVVVATTSKPDDDAIELLAKAAGVQVYRGHPNDVLDRYINAALEAKADKIIRVTGDCPLINPDVIKLVSSALTPDYDYASNLYPRSYPKGLDCEALWFDTLLRLHRISLPHELEHVTPAIGRCRDLFRIANVTVNWSVDTQEDLDRIRKRYELL